MSYFQELEGEAAIVVENGVFRQVALAKREDGLYAKYSAGFIRLMRDGSTSKAGGKARWVFISCKHTADALGRLTVQP